MSRTPNAFSLTGFFALPARIRPRFPALKDGYIQNGNFSRRKLSDLLEEFSAVREATICLIRSLDDAAWQRRGVASQKEVSVLALAFIIAGHDRHHRIILEKNYLSAAASA